MQKKLVVILDAELLKKLKVRCAEEEVTIKSVIEKLIKKWLKEKDT